ncbi:MAG TPA: Hsp20/alpha crystallin family protein [Candidatus Tripitaka californicus]|uniref:Hsp20/alpha crystallin family protein n=1 Tax=Candidatus Tripitaka californicus TaxID=3367616 RepID=UPI004028C202|nr:Hsp20/alpha crystallin family protein [Planctomycetota bacterium]
MADIMKWPEIPTFGSLQREMDRLFEDFFRRGGLVRPSVDVVETNDTVVVKAELPGMEPKDVDISVSDDRLTIKGERKAEKEEKGKTFYRMERCYGSFSRTIELPASVEADKAKADYKNGVLEITLPKTEQVKAKKIPIKTNNQ